MNKFFRNNGLVIVFFLFFVFALLGQIIFGIKEYNDDRLGRSQPEVCLCAYLHSGHFLESLFENWESEFLQMGLYVWFTVFLRQKGSSESKEIDKHDERDDEPDPERKDAPWPVKKGGLVLALYKNSLTISLLLLFLISFVLHFYGSIKDENEILSAKGMQLLSITDYMLSSRFWFESFQNWQSEFLSVFAIVILSIFLRQKGSSQSKKTDAPYYETGD